MNKKQTKKKIGRNDPCPCKSGRKYKYCCIGKDLKQRIIPLEITCEKCGSVSENKLDVSNDIMNVYATICLPLKNFMKDNNLYFFGYLITLGDMETLNEKLRTSSLKSEDIMNLYKSKAEICNDYLDMAISEMDIFKKREQILKDAFEAHFKLNKYTLSISTLFPLLEGILRDLGGLGNRDKFRSTIPRDDEWTRRYLFSMADDADYFNGFVSRLFEGGKDGFNRNSILHGFNIEYDSEEHSLLLILCLIEIRSFDWFTKNTKKLL